MPIIPDWRSMSSFNAHLLHPLEAGIRAKFRVIFILIFHNL
jgi:hypothetical protein